MATKPVLARSLTGDLNCRIGSLSNDVDGSYSENPDTMVNTHGSRLKKWLPGKNLVVVNGYTDAEKEFDTNFTFYRSTSTRMYRSQNDLMIVVRKSKEGLFSFTLDIYISELVR